MLIHIHIYTYIHTRVGLTWLANSTPSPLPENLDFGSFVGEGANGSPPAREWHQLGSCSNASAPLVPYMLTCASAASLGNSPNLLRLFNLESEVRTRVCYIYIYTYTYIHIYTSIYMCFCRELGKQPQPFAPFQSGDRGADARILYIHVYIEWFICVCMYACIYIYIHLSIYLSI